MGLISYTNLADGTGIDAGDVNTPFNAIYNEFIGNISADNIVNGTITPAKLTDSADVEQFRTDACVDFVVSGLGVTTSAGLIGAIASGVAYIGGVRLEPIGNPSKTFTASKDTYIDLDTSGELVYTEVTNGAASPALTSGYFRLAKVVTGASAITTITYKGIDSLGNVYRNLNPFGFTVAYFPTLTGSWVNYTDANYLPVTYAKDKTGRVSLTGLIYNGTVTAATTIMTLPVGFRPVTRTMVMTISNNVLCRLDVWTTGEVKIGTGASATWMNLSDITFQAL